MSLAISIEPLSIFKVIGRFTPSSIFKPGDSWNQRYGTARIVSEYEHGYNVFYSHGIAYRIPEDQMDSVIKKDEEASRRENEERRIREEEISRLKEEKAIKEDTLGFADNMPAIRRAKVVEVLNKVFRFDGASSTRKDFIVRKIKSGYKVNSLDGKRVLMSDDGCFWDETSLTKIGMDFAEYLQKDKMRDV